MHKKTRRAPGGARRDQRLGAERAGRRTPQHQDEGQGPVVRDGVTQNQAASPSASEANAIGPRPRTGPPSWRSPGTAEDCTRAEPAGGAGNRRFQGGGRGSPDERPKAGERRWRLAAPRRTRSAPERGAPRRNGPAPRRAAQDRLRRAQAGGRAPTWRIPQAKSACAEGTRLGIKEKEFNATPSCWSPLPTRAHTRARPRRLSSSPSDNKRSARRSEPEGSRSCTGRQGLWSATPGPPGAETWPGPCR